ncbi:MAG TPA: alpha/beta hydrolase [Polyangiaceae bacterium]|nr:alpha/beta hydrolase [Polyangiaceae bacterium]
MHGRRTLRRARCALVLGGWLACSAACASSDELGALVPPTADEDPALPRVQVTIGGHARWLHLETLGEGGRPVVLILPGGPGSDYRLLRDALAPLADEHLLVFWDQHGGGLSERVSRPSQLTPDSFDEEIAAVHVLVAPGEKVTLIGHSYGAEIALRYTALHPEAVERLVLIEPGPVNDFARDHRPTSFVGLDVFESLFWDNEVMTAQDHARADYRLLGVLRRGSRSFYCASQEPVEVPSWRFGAYAFEVVQREEGSTDYARGIEAFAPRVLLIAGTCGDLQTSFQQAYNLPALPRADLVRIEGAGHFTLFLDYAPQTLAAIRAYLAEAP